MYVDIYILYMGGGGMLLIYQLIKDRASRLIGGGQGGKREAKGDGMEPQLSREKRGGLPLP